MHDRFRASFLEVGGIILVFAVLLPPLLHAQDAVKGTAAAHRSFGMDCMSCHTTDAWKPVKKDIRFDHRRTGYGLTGKHETVACDGCHATVAFKDLKTTCASCHKDQHKGELGNRCQDCHTPAGWRSPNEQAAKHQFTRFPLLGAHLHIDCQDCHRNQESRQYAGTPTDCYSCHRDAYEAASEPGHAANGFDHQCTTCHDITAESWSGSFRHPFVAFKDSPAHASLSCAQCHASGYTRTPKDCYGCHQRDYASALMPNHVGGNYDHDCTLCHDPVAWKPARFNHDQTLFPLQGAHAATPCVSCHTAGYTKLSRECWSCHEPDYTRAAFPNHVQGQFSRDCSSCHTFNAWSPAAFSHDNTNFRLTGAHVTTPCQQCHVGGKYTGMPLECQGCHEQNYLQTTQPNHGIVGFTRQCADCHGTTAWQPVERMPLSIDHARTRFPLEGAHAQVPCERCHANFVFRGTPTDCFACHQADYAGARNPDHAGGGFDHQCTTCHGMQGWKPATFTHDKTAFPLTGAHATTPCERCHTGGNYTLRYTDCWQCHQTDFTQAQTPNHALGQFPHDCTTCHSTAGWKPSTFSHAATALPLQGAHASTPCQQCHVNGRYTGLPSDCWSCHQADYTKATQPDHVQGQFSHDCTTCHGFDAWKPSSFNHATTRFPLAGAHAAVPCQNCHINGRYANLPTDCYSCHQTDFTTAQQPSHILGQFPHDCTTCHSMTAWKPSTFDHAATTFALQGAHASTPCQQCHINGRYAGLPTDCWTCHQADYQRVTTPNHVSGQFNHDCTFCHALNAWKPAQLDHAKTRLPLTGKHTAVACEQCHINGQYGTQLPTDCWSCHQQDYQQVAAPSHAQAQFPHACETCHTTTGWKPSTFDHASTKFPLQGAHASRSCQECHTGGNYNLQYVDCWQCHQNDFTSAQSPNHTAARFGHDCTQCHSNTSWKPSTFNHATTKFPLQGAHTAQPCQACHTGGNYNLQYVDCWQCHQNDFTSAQSPNHAAAQFPHDCTQCHGTLAWKPSTFNHATTAFPLDGAHAAQPCQTCHTAGNYQLHYTDCWQCHQADFTRVPAPNHAAGQFPHDCTKCHGTASWKPSTFDHATTRLPLRGAHMAVPCEQCHAGGNFTLQYSDCYQCHQAQFTGVKNPDHVANQFSHACTICHTETAWKPAALDHSKTGFPLTGQHASARCDACHVNGNYSLTYTDCKQCHASDLAGAKNPDHIAGQFPSDCQLCHTSAGWKPASFSHAATAFPLQGGHAALACQQCHANGNYSLKYTDCWQCHQATYTNAQNPNHATAQFPHDCTQCHGQASWRPSTFSHAGTRFPLTGGHATVPCQQCHISGNYALTYTDCWQCHQTTYMNVQSPSHSAGQFPHDCTQCHTVNGWTPSTFSHATTKFPLQGAHAAQPCQSCHISGNYALQYQDCWQCHQATYNATRNPDHAGGQFSHDCLSCHTQNAWSPATFDHALTHFPLQGAHASLPCQNCHVGGNYTLVYTDCYQCHQNDYSGATTPNHVSNQFPHTCLTCHTQSTWTPSTFSHATTAFPLTGAHQAQPCSACHIAGNYALHYTDCWQCHQSDYTGTTSPNHAANMFSHDCTTCHTTAAWQPSTFNHASTAFALQGAHTSLACVQCHVNGNYQLTYTGCWQCHQSDYTNTSSPADHAAMSLDHICTTCHTQTAWTPATPFRTNHNVNYPNGFPIYSGSKHPYSSRWTTCSQCHTTNVTSAFCCTGCHSNASSLASDHHSVTGYSFSCTSCVASGCHPDGRAP